MYYSEDKDQLIMAEFAMPFAGKLDPKNRWVCLASIMPWDKIEEIYLRTMSEAAVEILPRARKIPTLQRKSGTGKRTRES